MKLSNFLESYSNVGYKQEHPHLLHYHVATPESLTEQQPATGECYQDYQTLKQPKRR